VNDTHGDSATSTAALKVTPVPLVISSLTAGPNPVLTNHTTYINITATGGWGTLVYAFSGLPSMCLSSDTVSLSCTPNAVGNYSVRGYVNDSVGQTVSSTVLLIVAPLVPTIYSFAASPTPIYVNHTTFLNVSAAGGTGAIGYAYSGLPSGCLTSNTKSLTCAPSVTGTFTVRVYANDSLGQSSTATTSLVVRLMPQPTIGSFKASPNPIMVTHTTYLNVSASGGIGTLRYAFSGLPAGCSSQDLASLTCTPTVSGTFHVRVYVNDSLSQTANTTLTLTVTPLPVAIYSFTASPSTIYVNHTTFLNVTAKGGSGPLTYTYVGLPPGCDSHNLTSVACVPSAVGVYTLRVYANDSTGHFATLTTVLNVTLAPSTFSITSFVASPNPVDVNGRVTLTAVLSGGTAPYSYAYSGLPTGCSSMDQNPFTCVPQTLGSFDVNITAYDSLGLTAGSVVALVVISPLSVALASNSTNITVGQSILFTATVTGGEVPYTYSWALNGTNVTAGPDSRLWTETFPHGGQYTVQIWVTDSLGDSVVSMAKTISVSSGSSTSGSPAEFPWWILLVVIAAMLAVLLIFVVYRRRSRRRPEDTAGTAAPIAETAPYPATEMGPPAMEAPIVPGAEMAGTAVATEAMMEPPAPQSPEETLPEETLPEVQPGPEPAVEPLPAPPEETQPIDMLLPPPPPPPPPPPAQLTACPQCGGPLDENMSCQTCGVAWVPEQPGPEGEAPQEPAPTGTEGEGVPEATPPPPDNAPEEVPAEPMPQPETPAPPESPLPPFEAPAPSEVPPAPEIVESPVSPQPPEETASLPASAPAPAPGTKPDEHVCFICGTKLQGNFCPTCKMHWEGDTPIW
jgi:hypothetical protein